MFAKCSFISNKKFVLFFIIELCFAFDYLKHLKSREFLRKNLKVIDLNKTYFSPLENYQVNASPTTEQKYPWIAKVVHSTTSDLPHLCTAVCVDRRIFITASKCVNSLKVKWTSVVYKSKRLPVRAFIFPSKPTKQQYDDIAFIVIDGKPNEVYDTVKLFNEIKRTDETFLWFGDMNFNGAYKVVGYATKKGIHKIKDAATLYNLTELPIVIGIDICSTILTVNHRFRGFNVPCYHSCTVNEFKKNAEPCKSYHGVEGGAIIDVNNKVLLGLATWGSYYFKYELPVGFSVVNSKPFYQDFECAKKVRDANPSTQIGYQPLCE